MRNIYWDKSRSFLHIAHTTRQIVLVTKWNILYSNTWMEFKANNTHANWMFIRSFVRSFDWIVFVVKCELNGMEWNGTCECLCVSSKNVNVSIYSSALKYLTYFFSQDDWKKWQETRNARDSWNSFAWFSITTKYIHIEYGCRIHFCFLAFSLRCWMEPCVYVCERCLSSRIGGYILSDHTQHLVNV